MSGELRLLAKERCLSDINCAAVQVLSDGRVAVTGVPVTLPADAPAGVGPGEAAVVIPAQVFEEAARAALNRLVEHDRHAREMDDLRNQQHALRTRQRTD